MRNVLTIVPGLAGVLAVSACGSGQHAVFTAVSKVGPLSVPTPSGFHARTWPGGVVISDRAGKIPIPLENQAGLAGYPRQDELAVYTTLFHERPPTLSLPLTLNSLEQASDGLTEWRGGGSIGGGQYVVDVWLGKNASAAHRAALLSALRTIKSR
ncbi:MAG TPA: hypothetical protein VGH79_08025 [Gaiellaceae bacterium]|jgi:hypothetical protein